MAHEVWIELGEGIAIGVTRDAAMTMSERDFARFYRKHVLTASRRQAREWARRQVAERSRVAASTAPGVPGSPTAPRPEAPEEQTGAPDGKADSQ